jgi:S1-C subfamily serine protease
MRAQLLHLSGPGRGRTITCESPVVSIGSAPDNVAVFDMPQVAPQHARIDYVESECAFHLRVLAGRVFVNGTEVEEVILQDEDRLEFGVDGPQARFSIYVPIGAACKPVRRMLADARAVGKVSGSVAATRTLTRDLFTQATMKLKVGFPVAVVAIAGLAFAGSWLGSREIESRRQSADSVTQAELAEMRERQRVQQEALAKLARQNATIGRIQKELSRGVCLMHGVYRLRQPDQNWLSVNGNDPFEIEYTGSGFLVSRAGHVVTNRHVVAPWLEEDALEPLIAAGARPEFVHLTATFPGRASIDVPMSGIHRRTDDLDVAVVQLDAAAVKDLPVLPMRTAPPDPEDQRAIVVGYPAGLAALLARADTGFVDALRQRQASMTDAITELAATNLITPVITQGVLGNVRERLLEYDAATWHGGSGGPVFDGSGQVIGVNYAILPSFSGTSYGVPIRFARELLPQ